MKVNLPVSLNSHPVRNLEEDGVVVLPPGKGKDPALTPAPVRAVPKVEVRTGGLLLTREIHRICSADRKQLWSPDLAA